MSIDVICPTCDQVHKVKNESAGKKLRCKGCQAVIPIPATSEAEEADPWDTGDIEEPAPRQAPRPAPRQRKAQAAKPARARARSTDGMPITIIAALGINWLLIAFNVCFTAIYVAAVLAGIAAFSDLIRCIIRLAVEFTINKGLRGRSNRIRWNVIILDGTSLTLLVCLGALYLFLPQLGERIPPDGRALTLLSYGAYFVLCVAELSVLLSPSARDYCSE